VSSNEAESPSGDVQRNEKPPEKIDSQHKTSARGKESLAKRTFFRSLLRGIAGNRNATRTGKHPIRQIREEPHASKFVEGYTLRDRCCHLLPQLSPHPEDQIASLFRDPLHPDRSRRRRRANRARI